MKQILILIATVLLPINVLSQNNIDETLKTYFTKYLHGESTGDISGQLLKFDGEKVFKAVEHCTVDSSANKRYAAYKLVNYLGHHFTAPELQSETVKLLITGCNDKDAGIVRSNLNSLATFDAKIFTAEMKYILSEMAKKPHTHYQMVIKICGWLQTTDLIYNFRQMIADQKINIRDRWTMRVAMARMGEADMIDYILQKVKGSKVNDDIVYEIIPDLVYTRQKALFDYMLECIESDEKNCGASNPDSHVKVVCGYRIMEMIAPYIENFPVKIKASGDIDTKDYDKALLDVRNWIKQNRETYGIKKEGF